MPLLTDIQGQEEEDGSMVIDEPPRNTSKVKLPDSCVLRRSLCNRTQLFVNEAEDYEELRCSASITQYVDRTSRFHSLRALNSRTAEDYAATKLHCWHDTRPFEGPVVPLPRSFDAAQQSFVVYGCFCSLSCAKAFLCEQATSETNMQLILLDRMASELYHVKQVVAAPPRLALDVFGGPYSIEGFRGVSKRCEVTMVTPPFVSSYMVCEERDGEESGGPRISALGFHGISSVRGLRRPAKPVDMGTKVTPEHSPYLELLKTRGVSPHAPPADVSDHGNGKGGEATAAGATVASTVPASLPPPRPTRASTRRSASTTNGTLARFMDTGEA